MTHATTRIRRRYTSIIAASLGLTLAALSGCASSGGATSEPTSNGTTATSSAPGSDTERETVTITDELGREVELQIPIQAVYPDLWYQTEIVRAIGAADTIVAVEDTAHPEQSPANADYFAEFAGLSSVGNYNEPNWEEIVNSGAEVFFARRNSPWQDAVAKLEPFGIKVVVVTTWDPIVLREYLPLLGEIFGAEEGAAQLAALYDDIEVLLEERLADVTEPKSVYFENNADFSTSTPGSGWHDTIVLGGGENLFADINAGTDQSASVHNYVIDPVAVVERNPDVIVRAGAGGQPYGYAAWERSTFIEQAQQIADRPAWAGTTAVQNGDVFVFNNFFYSALGKQLGALAVAKWLYPEEFEDINLDDYFARWLEPQGVEPRPAELYFHRLGD